MFYGSMATTIFRHLIPSGNVNLLRSPLTGLVLALFASVTLASAGTDRVILVRLFHGQNEGIRDDLAENQALKNSLIALVGYRYYEEVGASYALLNVIEPQFVAPCRSIYVKFQPHETKAALFHFELFHGEKSLVKGEFVPRPSIPLIITGPFYDKGRLVLVMTRADKKELPSSAKEFLTERPRQGGPEGMSSDHQASPVSHRP